MVSPAMQQKGQVQSPHRVRLLLNPDVLAPIGVGLLMLVAWELAVRLTHTPPYLLPGPILILTTLFQEWPTLLPSWFITMKIAFYGPLCGNDFGIAGGHSVRPRANGLSAASFPMRVLLQTTPIVAKSPP